MNFRKTIVISISVLVICFICFLCVAVDLSVPDTTPAETKIFFRERTPQLMKFTTFYSLCGHKENYSAYADRYYENETQVKQDYPFFKTDKFTENLISLSKEESSYCNIHYHAILKEEMIYIYSRLNNTVVYEFPAIRSRLTEEEISSLEKGIDFDSKESMLSFVEDYTS